MKALRIAWIVVIVLFFPLLGTGFFTYSQQKKEKKKANDRIEALKKKIERLEKKNAHFEELKKKGHVTLKDLYMTKDNWWYLGELEGIKKKFRPNFRNISASKIKEDKNFTRFSRLVKISSSFPEAVDLMDNLEFANGFQIEGLDIHADEKNSEKHGVEFWMSFSRVKQDVIDKLAAALTGKKPKKTDKKYYERSLRMKPVWKRNRRLVLKRRGRDPFVDLKKRREEWLEKLKAAHEEKEKTLSEKKETETLVKQNVDFSDKLVLKGILSIKGIKMAILDAQYKVNPERENLYRYNVKIGDFVGEKKVVRIDNNQVVLKHQGMTYFSTMLGGK
jgi:hypothetical protein